jgi:hypothetical protein
MKIGIYTLILLSVVMSGCAELSSVIRDPEFSKQILQLTQSVADYKQSKSGNSSVQAFQPTAEIAPTSTSQASSTRESPAGSARSNSESAMQCIQITRPNSGWAQIHNRCSYIISVSWCYSGTTDCRNGTWGFTSTGNIAAGGVISASTFISQSAKYGLAYGACTGRDVSIQETGPKVFNCK